MLQRSPEFHLFFNFLLFLIPANLTTKVKYEGLTCHPRSFVPNRDYIPYPSLFIGETNCVFWESGKFLTDSQPISSPRLDSINYKLPCNSKIYSEGFFLGGKWVTTECRFNWLMPENARNVLVNKRILFTGDSIVRQLYLRFVSYIRGIEVIIEHYFHKSSFYAFNSTHDCLQVDSYWNQSRFSESADTSCTVSNALFVAEFMWDPLVTGAPNSDPSILKVTGLHYWAAKGENVGLEEFVTKVNETKL